MNNSSASNRVNGSFFLFDSVIESLLIRGCFVDGSEKKTRTPYEKTWKVGNYILYLIMDRSPFLYLNQISGATYTCGKEILCKQACNVI